MSTAILDPEAEYVTPSKAAKMLDRSAQRVRQLVDSGELASVRTPLGRLIDARAVLARAEHPPARRSPVRPALLEPSDSMQRAAVPAEQQPAPQPAESAEVEPETDQTLERMVAQFLHSSAAQARPEAHGG